MWEPSVLRARPSVPLWKVSNGDIWFNAERDWSQECSNGNDIVGVILFLLWCTFLVISGAKFEEHCSNISGDILDSVFYNNFSGAIYDIITFLICITQAHIHVSLQRKKIFQKGKHHSYLLWEASQISSNHFLPSDCNISMQHITTLLAQHL